MHKPINEVITKDFPDVACFREMRKQLFEASYKSHILRRIFDTAAMNGLSGEELYVMACYYLWLEVDASRERELEALRFAMPKPIMVPKPEDEGR